MHHRDTAQARRRTSHTRRILAAAMLTAGLAAQGPGAATAQPLDWRDEARDRVLTNAADSYVVTIEVTREGSDRYVSEYLENGRTSDTLNTWRHGPSTYSTRLVTLDGAHNLGDDSLQIELASWQAQLDQWLEWTRNQKAYQVIGDELNEVLDEVEALSEDAELILRVLEGIEFYTHIEDRHWDPDSPKPSSGKPFVYFEGAQARQVYDGPDDPPQVKTDEMPRWTSDEPGGKSTNAGEDLELVVWRYTPEDMARIQELADREDELLERLTLDLSGVELDATMQRVHAMTPQHFHWTFRDPFLSGVRDVIRLAWWLGPAKAPDGFWATGADRVEPFWERYLDRPDIENGLYVDFIGTPYLDKDREPRLPPLPTDTLITLSMPQLGFPTDHPGESSAPYGEWRGQYGTRNNRRENYRYTVGAPQRERHTLLDRGSVVHSDSLVHAAVEGERFNGRLTIDYEFVEETFNDSRTSRYFDEEHETYQILWTVEHNGEIWKPRPVEIAARLVKPQGGKFIPFEGPLRFGDAFALEGRLEKPAARPVYRLKINRGENDPFDVFLYPTDDDPNLVRSKIHYLMWDVAHGEDNEDGENSGDGETGAEAAP